MSFIFSGRGFVALKPMYNSVDSISYKTPHSGIKLGCIASACLGLLLLFTGPVNNKLLVHFGGSYRLNLFEFVSIPIFMAVVTAYGIKIKRYERILFLSLVLVIIARIISLLAAEQTAPIQWASVIRYASSTIGVLYVLAILLSDPKNRKFFLLGLCAGVSVETIGALVTFVLAHGRVRGYFLTVGGTTLQLFLLLACVLVFVNRSRRILSAIMILFLLTGMLITLSRGTWMVIIVAIVAMLLYMLKYTTLKKSLSFVSIVALAVLVLFMISVIVPWTTEHFLTKLKHGISPEEGDSVLERLAFIDMCLKGFLKRPITGMGASAFKGQVQLFEIPRSLQHSFRGGTPHNTVAGVLGETGLAGLAAFLVWIVAAVGIACKAIRSAKSSIFANKFVVAASLSIIILIISDSFGENSFLPPMNALMGFVLGWLRENTRQPIIVKESV